MSAAPLLTVLLPLLLPAPAAPHPQDGEAHGDTPQAAPGMAQEARDAMARFVLPDGFEVSLFAAEPLMAHPVAFCIDGLGRFFVAETFRHQMGVTDIRQHMDWLEDDLAIKTVADRVAMFRKHMSPEAFEEEYATAAERVTRLVDTDGDGEADLSTVFADGFDDPAAGIAAGVLAETLPGGGTKLWFTCIPDLWRLVDADGDGVAEERERHSTGYGLRVALLGHDMHGLTVGPLGRIYFSIGDRGFNVETPEGERLVRFGTGAVFRCEPDGSNLELFCDGLRNPQELVFDEAGNLFTLDNNSDGGDKARWTMLLEGSDTGWRQAYQWVRQPHNRGPWNQEKLWHPYHPEQPYYVLPCIVNFTSGPSGLCQYPGTGFGPEWNGTFFVCDFRGNPGYSGIYYFRNEPKMSGFELADTARFVWEALPTDVDFGPDGNLYWSDWVTGWNRTGKGRIFRVAPKERSAEEQARVDDVRTILAEGFGHLDAERAFDLLGHADRRVREGAQLELARRVMANETDAPAVESQLLEYRLLERVEAVDGTLQRLHALRALGQASRMRSVAHLALPLAENLNSSILRRDPWAAEALRAVSEALDSRRFTSFPLDDGDHGVDWLSMSDVERAATSRAHVASSVAGSLTDPRPHVRRAAVEALGRLGARSVVIGAVDGADANFVAEVLGVLEREGADDPWMRHACIRALERMGAHDEVIARTADAPEHVRRAVVVLLRRAGDARVAGWLEDASPLVRAEAARAIHDVPIAAAMPALAERLPYLRPDDTTLTWRRVLQANREVATAEAARRLADFAVRPDADQDLRVEAIELLGAWTEARTRDGIVMDHRPIPGGDRAGLVALRAHPLMASEIIETALRPVPLEGRELSDEEINAQQLFGEEKILPPSAPRVAAAMIGLHDRLAGIGDASTANACLRMLAAAEELPVAERVRAFEVLMARYGDDPRTRGFARAARTLPGLAPLKSAAYGAMPDAEAAAALDEAARSADPAARREAIRVLGTLRKEACMEIFAAVGETLAADAPELVEWLEGAEGHPAESVAAALAARRAAWEGAADALDPWRMCLTGGDAAAGREVFTTKSETSCMKCHVVGGEGGSEAGPVLDGVAARLAREELLRSVVEPNAAIAEGFETWVFSLTDGEVLAGRILEEEDGQVVVETQKKEVWELPADEIAARRRDVSAMPGDVSTHLSRREMRDLIAFLASLQD